MIKITLILILFFNLVIPLSVNAKGQIAMPTNWKNDPPATQPGLKDWITDKPESYGGIYQAEVPPTKALTQKPVWSEIEIRTETHPPTAFYRVSANKNMKDSAEAELSGVKLKANHFTSDPISVKADWPFYLPPNFRSRFVEPEGLICDGILYHRKKK